MSETSTEPKPENNVDQQEQEEPSPAKRPKRAAGSTASKRLSSLAEEAKAILKDFAGDKEDAPEGRRTTRSSLRGAAAPVVATPPPPKRERKSSSSTNSTSSSASTTRGSTPSRRGRKSKKDVEEKANDEQHVETNHTEDVEMKELAEEASCEKTEKDAAEVSSESHEKDDESSTPPAKVDGTPTKDESKDTKEKSTPEKVDTAEDKTETKPSPPAAEVAKTENGDSAVKVATTNGNVGTVDEEKASGDNKDETSEVECKKNALGDVTSTAGEKTIPSDETPTKTSVTEEKSLNSENKVTLLSDSAAVQSAV